MLYIKTAFIVGVPLLLFGSVLVLCTDHTVGWYRKKCLINGGGGAREVTLFIVVAIVEFCALWNLIHKRKDTTPYISPLTKTCSQEWNVVLGEKNVLKYTIMCS